MTTFLDYLTSNYDHDMLLNIAQFGADKVPGLIHTVDLLLLYDEYQTEIFDAIAMDAEDSGYESPVAFIATFRRAEGVVDSDTFKERLVWWMAEREAQRYADACEHGEVG